MEDAVLSGVEFGDPAARGCNDSPNRIHGLHGCKNAPEATRCDGAQDRGAQKNGLGFLWENNAAPGDIGMLAQEHRVLGAPACGKDGVDRIAVAVHLIDDMARSVCDRLDCRQVLKGEVVGGGRERQSAYYAS